MEPESFRLLESFTEMLAAERAASINTVLSYKADIIDYLGFLAQRKSNLLTSNIEIFGQYLSHLHNKQLKPRSLARKISAIKQFYGFLVSEKYIAKNPLLLIEMPKICTSLPRDIALTDMEKLLNAAKEDQSAEGKRLQTIIEVLYATGMRVSELTALKLQNLQYSASSAEIADFIIIKGKGGKERMVALAASSINTIKEYLNLRKEFIPEKASTDWLFPSLKKNGKISHITRQRVGQLLKELSIKAGMDHKMISPHKVRHAFATHMLNAGANLKLIQELLGHVDITTTQIYTKVASDKAKDLVLNSHPLVEE